MLETICALLAAWPMFLAWVGCFWIFREMAARQQIDADWRLSWVFTTIVWASSLTAIVEAASFARKLDRPTLQFLWWLLDAGLLFTAVWLAKKRHGIALVRWTPCWKNLARRWIDSPLEIKCLLGGTALLASALLAIALLTPSTNCDSLGYHAPRVLHWLQQQSVEHFATNNERQIQYGPWSSFVLLNFQLLCGHDRLFNLPQWSALLTCLIALSLAAEKLLTGPHGQSQDAVRPAWRKRAAAWTVFLIVTLPIGVVEAITAQNDYIVAAWASCLFLLALELRLSPANRICLLGVGLACGLGVLTKVTFVLCAAPLVLLLGGWLVMRSRTWRERWVCVGCCSVSAVLLTAPHFYRNYALYGSPFGSRREFHIQRNQTISLSGTASNLIRHLALNTNTGLPPLTRASNAVLNQLHTWTGRDLSDPTTTYQSQSFAFIEEFFVSDCYASSPAHLLLVFLSLGLAWLRWRQNRAVLLYGAVVIAGALLFCGYLRFQPLQTRFHLPYLVLLAPLIAVMLAQSVSRWWIPASLLGGLALLAITKNDSRPVLDRAFLALPRSAQSVFFVADFHQEFGDAADAIMARGCQTVGLKLSLFEYEYPFWLALRERGFTGEVRHVYVENESARLGTVLPCVILTDYEKKVPPTARRAFPRREAFGNHTLLWPEPP